MVADGDDRFMLCAVRKNRDYYLSHLESFLDVYSSTGSLRGAVAVVRCVAPRTRRTRPRLRSPAARRDRRLSDRKFRLYSYSCELCGDAVGCGTCDVPVANEVIDSVPSSHRPHCSERQVLLDVEQVSPPPSRGPADAAWLIPCSPRPTTSSTT